MLIWSPVLHFYQPPTQDIAITHQVLKSNYIPILRLLEKNPDVHVTLNITGSLTLQLQELEAEEFFDLMNILTERGQVEVLSTPLYHPLLPIISTSVAFRQIEYNSQITRQFYNTETINGIYPPELAVNADLIDEFNGRFTFSLISESSINPDVSFTTFPKHSVMKYKDLALLINTQGVTEILRSHQEHLTAKNFINFLKTHRQNENPIISVNDVELFGHHYPGRLDFFEDLMHQPDLRFRKLTEVLAIVKDTPTIEKNNILPGTWETTYKDHQNKNYFPTWFAPGNDLQQQYVGLMNLAGHGFELLPRPENDENLIYSSAEKHYDRGISSCHLFWLSNYPWWHPDLVQAGAEELIRSIRTLPGLIELKQQGEVLYSDFTKGLWLKHWSGEIEKGYAKFDQDRIEFYRNLPQLSE